jgi:hypothetical protein
VLLPDFAGSISGFLPIHFDRQYAKSKTRGDLSTLVKYLQKIVFLDIKSAQ